MASANNRADRGSRHVSIAVVHVDDVGERSSEYVESPDAELTAQRRNLPAL